MIKIQLAGITIGIENQYNFRSRIWDWRYRSKPDFVVRVSPEELEREDRGRGMAPEYLEFVCAYRHIAEQLPDYDAFVFHGAAVAMDGRAYLFTAPSGTGKTTHATLWKEHFGWPVWYLNGDKPILRRRPDGSFLAFGTPWRGKEGWGVNASLPVQSICLLHRGEENRIVPAEPEESVRFLLRQIYLPQEEAHMKKLLALVDECCRTVPTWSMQCTISEEAAALAYEAMKPK